jgi:hypothetical protein
MRRVSLRKAVTESLVKQRRSEIVHKRRALSRLEAFATDLIKAGWYVAITVVLTGYALTGDDFRLMCTEKPVDPYFDIVTLIALLFFIIDMILSSLGKRDYFMGNMFLLDAFSSFTMLLDFSFIDITGLDKKNIDNFRSARTARLGVRASRIVWTIRQLRCYKVCKAKFSSNRADAFAQEMMSITGSENGKTDPGESMPEEESQTEGLMTQSNVGRSLSELTVCRVIAVVLAMVVILPFMQLGEEIQLPTTAEYASDEGHITDWKADPRHRRLHLGLPRRFAY